MTNEEKQKLALGNDVDNLRRMIIHVCRLPASKQTDNALKAIHRTSKAIEGLLSGLK